jgi:type IV fimbrial biogenesis protein FimT
MENPRPIKPASPPAPQRGFTLVELMLALVVAAILLSVAIPSFTGIVRDNRMASAVNALSGAIHLARTEAIRRNTRVTLCKSNDGSSCANNGSWEQGWIVFAEDGNTAGNTYGARDANETILRIQDSIGNNITMAGSSGNVSSLISFLPDGIPVQNGNIKVCDSRTGNVGRELQLIASGRLRVKKQGVSCP